MTEENKKHNIGLEVARAEARLDGARSLFDGGHTDNALALVYYVVFHYARALLLMEGLEAKTHSGVGHLINLHFVRTGRLSPEVSEILGQLQRRRETAEYDPASEFTPAMVAGSLQLAEEFRERSRELLGRGGYL